MGTFVLMLAMTCQSNDPTEPFWVFARDGNYYWGYVDASNRVRWSATPPGPFPADPRVRNFGVMKEPRPARDREAVQADAPAARPSAEVRVTADSPASARKVAEILGTGSARDHVCPLGDDCPGPRCPNRPRTPDPAPAPAVRPSPDSAPWMTIAALFAATCGVMILIRRYVGGRAS